MKKLLMSLGLLIIFLSAGSTAQAATYYVSRDGSGTYNCDGSADQVQINQALQAAAKSPGSVVHLKPGKYVASDIIQIGSNTTLEGDAGVTVTFADGFWPDASLNRALIMYNPGLSSSKGPIVIKKFEIDGNYNQSTVSHACSKRTFMFIEGVSDLEIYDMYWHNSCNDGIKVKNSNNVKIHNIKIDTLGHDSIVLQSCKNGDVYNNNIKTRGNAGIRLFGSGFISIHDNLIFAEVIGGSPGGPGLELQRGDKGGDLYDLEIYNNLIYHTCQPGIQLVTYGDPYTKDQVKNVHIHHNIIAECGWNGHIDWVAGISVSGVYNVVIESNTLDRNYGGAIIYMESMGLQSAGTSGKYDVYIRNNIVTNTKKRGGDAYDTPGSGSYTDSGQGIINYDPAEGSLFLENNLVYGNVGGDYKNVSSSSDIHMDPLFADTAKGDYHIKSIAGRWDPNVKSWVSDSVNSPAIDKGLPTSDYSREPEDNGDRINIGRYGNTSQASLSGNLRQATMPPAPVEDTYSGFSGSGFSGSGSGSSGAPLPGGDPSGGMSGPAYNTGSDNPNYYDPGKALTEQNYYQQDNPASSPRELALAGIFPSLGESAPTATDTCTDISGSAGFIPCGRYINDPDTPWNECDECDFCSIPLAIQLVLDFLIKISGIVAVLAIVLGQLLAMTSIGDTDKMVKIKAVLGKALLGFGYVMAAWLIVNALLAALGYTDPLGGEWYTVC